jgi:hypothetical protein
MLLLNCLLLKPIDKISVNLPVFVVDSGPVALCCMLRRKSGRAVVVRLLQNLRWVRGAF